MQKTPATASVHVTSIYVSGLPRMMVLCESGSYRQLISKMLVPSPYMLVIISIRPAQ